MLHSTYFCEFCKENCVGHIVDFGNGHTEFWGSPSIDVNKCFVSVCCDAQMYEDEEQTIPVDLHRWIECS